MRVRYTLRAQADLDAIYAYLDARAPAAALSVKATIERRIAALADFPRLAPETDQPGVHELRACESFGSVIARSDSDEAIHFYFQ